MDQNKKSFYFKIALELRSKGIVTDLYMGTSNMKAQLKYADKRNARVAIIIGEDEEAKNSVCGPSLGLKIILSSTCSCTLGGSLSTSLPNLFSNF